MKPPVCNPRHVSQHIARISLVARHGRVMLHQSGGCCDGSAPMCYPQAEFIVGDRDRLLGRLAGMPFSISGPQFEYWQHTS